MFDRDPLRGVLARQNVVTRTNCELFFRPTPDRPQKATQKVGISLIDPLFQRVAARELP